MPKKRPFLAALLRRLVLGKDLAVAIDALDTAPAAPKPAGSGPVWVPVPGGRLELVMDKLSGCGFYIVLDPTPGQPLYRLHSPEGAPMYQGFDLPGLKAMGERYALERTEFDAEPWPITKH